MDLGRYWSSRMCGFSGLSKPVYALFLSWGIDSALSLYRRHRGSKPSVVSPEFHVVVVSTAAREGVTCNGDRRQDV